MKLIKTYSYFVITFLIIFPLNSIALEQVSLSGFPPGEYSRRGYFAELLIIALEKTKSKYGPYTLKYTYKMTRNRAFDHIRSGKLSVYDAPTRPEWEENTIPVFIPLTKGLLAYRLLFIKEKDQEKFNSVKNIDDLRKLSTSLGSQWSTTKVLKAVKGFKIIESTLYKSLFHMLNLNRFDYFIRGINEIYGEKKNIENKFPLISIEKKLLLHIPMPIFFFVSKKKPQLAKRIEEGLLIAIEDGTFDKLFLLHHNNSIIKANVNKRRLISIGNPLYKKHPQYSHSKFWISLEELKNIK